MCGNLGEARGGAEIDEVVGPGGPDADADADADVDPHTSEVLGRQRILAQIRVFEVHCPWHRLGVGRGHLFVDV